MDIVLVSIQNLLQQNKDTILAKSPAVKGFNTKFVTAKSHYLSQQQNSFQSFNTKFVTAKSFAPFLKAKVH